MLHKPLPRQYLALLRPGPTGYEENSAALCMFRGLRVARLTGPSRVVRRLRPSSAEFSVKIVESRCSAAAVQRRLSRIIRSRSPGMLSETLCWHRTCEPKDRTASYWAHYRSWLCLGYLGVRTGTGSEHTSRCGFLSREHATLFAAAVIVVATPIQRLQRC